MQMLLQMGMPPELLQQLLAQLQGQQGQPGQPGQPGQEQMMPGMQRMPPEMVGGATPESLGMGAVNPEALPGVYREMVGTPRGENEEMDAMAKIASLRRQRR